MEFLGNEFVPLANEFSPLAIEFSLWHENWSITRLAAAADTQKKMHCS